ncbi:hypothetical protein P691DRAFT_772955 [Macrolepiota fuliginosa MF-IS2]|uniref:ER membrane protein complex subunit 10 n=1 Tax=Macrolepiota fuliginosa MF-IS2 TaxID=1400762 RepID=A0A9P5XIQ5_9AGAR|nr:hypothetical protein P691DRAFT_772955 [Macrolepiota fuliginosa MF-IS2]
MKSAAVLSAVLCPLLTAAESTHTIHHRVYHATLPSLPYSQHGTIHITDDAPPVFHPSPTLSEDLAAFSQLDVPLDSLFYQVALQRKGEDQSSWDFSSIKACHLPQVTSQTIILHTQDAKPFAVDYFASPIPLDGSCPQPGPRPKKKLIPISPFTAFAENVRGLNTTVLLKSPHAPPLPELRNPQPVTPAGLPIQPVPEKSFIQKYWMYIATAFVVLLLVGGEDEGPRRQAQA